MKCKSTIALLLFLGMCTRCFGESWKTMPQAPPQPALRYTLLPRLADRVPGDAAGLYRTAILLIPREQALKNALPDRQLKSVDDYLDMAIDQMPRDEVAALLKAYHASLEYLDLAARRDRCDWNWPFKDLGLATLLPEMAPMRDLSRVVRLRARLQILDKRYDDALGSLQTGFAMARDVGNGGVLVQMVVGSSIASGMALQVRELSEMNSADAPNLYWALAALPRPMLDFSATLEIERATIINNITGLRDMMQRKPLAPSQVRQFFLDTWAIAYGMSDKPQMQVFDIAVATASLYPHARRELIESGISPAELDALPASEVIALYQIRPFEQAADQTSKWSMLPFARGYSAMLDAGKQQQIIQDRYRTNGLVQFSPNLGRSWLLVHRLDRTIAAQQTVEALRAYVATHDGKLPASLNDLQETPAPNDPMTDAPFGYEVRGGGGGGATVILTAPAAPGEKPDQALRYEVTIQR